MGKSAPPGSLLSKALAKAQSLAPVMIEVLISRAKSRTQPEQLLETLWKKGILAEDQIVIYANPTLKRAGVWVGPRASIRLKASEWSDWIQELEADLRQTHPDRALALAVMSLGLALHSLDPSSHQR